ncbi:hypothetical protein HA075_23360 [bacterium BFN5]|nr:hypothetical protein HA075_23360 [bacterium BFN5]
MYIKQGILFRVFALRMKLSDPQQTEEVLTAVQQSLASVATEVMIESPMVTYDRDLNTNSNVILNFFLHLSNANHPDQVRLSNVMECLADCDKVELISVKLD